MYSSNMQDRLERMCMVGMRKMTGNFVTMFSFWVDIKTRFFKQNKAGALPNTPECCLKSYLLLI